MKIICVGRNYADHAKELNSPLPTEAVIFMKPDTALLPSGKPFYLPDFSSDLHHELELILKINKEGKNIEEKFANKYYDEITVGIDFTARDIQNKLKDKGLPWELAKSFDGSAAVGKFIFIKGMNEINFHLDINKKQVQKGATKDMIFSFDKIVSFISRYITLRKGDLVYTGTPAGVSRINVNDVLEGYIENEKLLEVKIK